ncbi:hypothetical protein D9M71_720960 [compost metagenome]
MSEAIPIDQMAGTDDGYRKLNPSYKQLPRGAINENAGLEARRFGFREGYRLRAVSPAQNPSEPAAIAA